MKVKEEIFDDCCSTQKLNQQRMPKIEPGNEEVREAFLKARVKEEKADASVGDGVFPYFSVKKKSLLSPTRRDGWDDSGSDAGSDAASGATVDYLSASNNVSTPYDSVKPKSELPSTSSIADFVHVAPADSSTPEEVVVVSSIHGRHRLHREDRKCFIKEADVRQSKRETVLATTVDAPKYKWATPRSPRHQLSPTEIQEKVSTPLKSESAIVLEDDDDDDELKILSEKNEEIKEAWSRRRICDACGIAIVDSKHWLRHVRTRRHRFSVLSRISSSDDNGGGIAGVKIIVRENPHKIHESPSPASTIRGYAPTQNPFAATISAPAFAPSHDPIPVPVTTPVPTPLPAIDSNRSRFSIPRPSSIVLPSTTKAKFSCKQCNLTCLSFATYESHIAGLRHKRNTGPKTSNLERQTDKLEAEFSGEPHVGLEYVQEYKYGMEIRYNCHVCTIATLRVDTLADHVKSLDHRRKYIQMLHISLMPSDDDGVETPLHFEREAHRLEGMHGRQRIIRIGERLPLEIGPSTQRELCSVLKFYSNIEPQSNKKSSTFPFQHFFSPRHVSPHWSPKRLSQRPVSLPSPCQLSSRPSSRLLTPLLQSHQSRLREKFKSILYNRQIKTRNSVFSRPKRLPGSSGTKRSSRFSPRGRRSSFSPRRRRTSFSPRRRRTSFSPRRRRTSFSPRRRRTSFSPRRRRTSCSPRRSRTSCSPSRSRSRCSPRRRRRSPRRRRSSSSSRRRSGFFSPRYRRRISSTKQLRASPRLRRRQGSSRPRKSRKDSSPMRSCDNQKLSLGSASLERDPGNLFNGNPNSRTFARRDLRNAYPNRGSLSPFSSVSLPRGHFIGRKTLQPQLKIRSRPLISSPDPHRSRTRTISLSSSSFRSHSRSRSRSHPSRRRIGGGNRSKTSRRSSSSATSSTSYSPSKEIRSPSPESATSENSVALLPSRASPSSSPAGDLSERRHRILEYRVVRTVPKSFRT